MGKHNRTWTEGRIDQVPEMEITRNWQSSKFLVKSPFIVPCYVYRFLNESMRNQEKLLNGCAREQHTYLLKTMTQKTLITIDRTCLSTTYKFLASVRTERTYSHLEQNDPLEQKGFRCGSYGCKDQLMINKIILQNCKNRKRNLSCAWIDYKKAFDSVSYEWIRRTLELFNVSSRVTGFLKHNKKK